MAEGYKNTEVGDIPKDWELVSYDDAFEFLTTATYPRAQLSHKENIGYVHYGDIHTKCLHFLDLDKITLPSIEKKLLKNYPILKEGDVIVVDASEDYEGVGKSVEVRNLKNRKAISGLHTFLLRGKNEKIANGFKGFIHSNKLVKKQMDTLATGLKVYGVSKTNLKQILIPLPPTLAEQSAIATALNDTDNLIQKLEQLLAKKRAIKTGAMQELLASTSSTRGKPKKGWVVKKLGEVGKPYGGLSGKSKLDFKDGNCPYIPFMNIMSNPVIDTTYFDYVKINPTESQHRAQKGDLFFNGSSETPEEVGMCSVLLKEVPNLYLNSFCFGFCLNKEENNNGLFLTYFFRSSYGRKIFFILAQGATRHNLSKNSFLKIDLPIPSPEEQIRIAQILSDMDAEIQALEKKIEKYKMIKQGMMQVLLTGKIRLVSNEKPVAHESQSAKNHV